MLTKREIIHYFSLKHQGCWEKTFQSIKKKDKVDEEEYKSICNHNSRYITILDDNYPESLKSIFEPPLVLYYYGDIALLNAKLRLTSIGTRNPTKYQHDYTLKMIKEVEEYFKSKVVVVSGLAKGLDLVSMKSAMKKKAPLIGVLGNGIDIIYPKESEEVYNYCKSGNGLLLSEYPNKTTPEKDSFIKRNRIIAALSKILFIGGGTSKSGSSTTIRFALEYNKEIMALPCNNTGDDLTNSLISDGAEPILSSSDLINRIKDLYNFS